MELTEETQEVTLYEHDVWNNMTKTIQGKTVVENRYNGKGQRVEKSAVVSGEPGARSRKYLYDGTQVVLELDEESQEYTENIYGHALIGRKSGQSETSFLYNGHGDVSRIINGISNTVASYSYDAFGNLLEDESEVDNPYKYAGYQHDEENGLYYLNSRFYDPETARFIQEDTYKGDTADPLSLNLYTYCVNNPLMYVDPTGYAPEQDGFYHNGEWVSYTDEEYDMPDDYYLYLNHWVRRDACLDCVYNWHKSSIVGCDKHTYTNVTIVEVSITVGDMLEIDVGKIFEMDDPTPQKIKDAGAICITNSEGVRQAIAPQEAYSTGIGGAGETYKTETRFVIGNNVRLRSAPGTNSKVLDTLSKGTEVKFTGQKTGVINGHMWAQVKYNDITGWIAATYLGISPPSGTDITKKLVMTVIRAVDENILVHFDNYDKSKWEETLIYFYEMVGNKGPLDLKQQPEWQSESFIFWGINVRSDAPGNIAYGMAGTILGIPIDVLHMAAGFAQSQAGTSKPEWQGNPYFGDDPYDFAMIELGWEYIQHH